MKFLQETGSGKNNAHTKRLNRQTILRLLRAQGKASRASLSRDTGLTLQTLSNIMASLEGSDLIRAAEKVSGARGQPAIPYSLNPAGGFGVGINLDEGRLYAAIMDFGFSILQVIEAPFAERTPEGVLRTVARVVRQLARDAGVPFEKIWGVGLAMPKLLDEEVENRHLLERSLWVDVGNFGVDTRLAEELGLAVFIENDANAGALGEVTSGAGRRVESFCYVHIARGLGCGVVNQGELFRGAWGNAGEIGRFVIDDAGAYLEELLSVDGLFAASGHPAPAVLTSETLGKVIDAQPQVVDAWLKQAAPKLRWLISVLENAYDPRAVVIGGQLPEPLLARLLDDATPLFESVADRPARDMERMSGSELGARAPVIGAAAIPLLATIQPVPNDGWRFQGRIRDVYEATVED